MAGGAPTEGDAGAAFEFRLLGPFEVRYQGIPLDLGGPQQKAVLAQLVLDAGRVVAVDRLIARLWGEDPPASALGTLQSYVSRLRRVLEPDRRAGASARVLVSEAPGYALRVPRTSVDVFRFQALADEGRAAADGGHEEAAVERFDAALAMWRGPALAGLGGEASLAPIIVRLEEERATVVEDRFEALLALGRHAQLVGPLQEAVAEEPLRERRWGQLALALYRSRRQAEALRALATARTTLAEELGLDPGPELQRLEAQILAHDPALVATPHPPVRPAVTDASPSAPAEAPLVGRVREWAALRVAMAEVEGGRPRTVLIEGEPGIGKTALLTELVREATQRGWRTAWGRCLEEGLAPALWPWVEVLRAIVQGGGTATDGEATNGDREPTLGPAVTEAITASTSGDVVVPASLVQLADEITSLATDVASTHPLLIVLDDLHWADQASLELLPLVVDRLRAGARVFVAVAHRQLDLGASSSFGRALGAVARVGATARLMLEGLGVDDVATVMATIGGERPADEVIERVHQRTGGNPLFVAELTRLLASSAGAGDEATAVPTAVRDVVRRRLARVPDHTRDLLAAAAVFGQEVDLRVLAVATDRSVDDCLDDIDPAVVIRVLVPGEHGFRFAHALIRDAVLVDLSPLRLARLHRRAADALEQVFGADRDHAEPIAAHRWAAISVDDPLKVTDALIHAGDAARRRGALDRAEELHERALQAATRLPVGDERLDREVEAVEQILNIETMRSFMSERLDDLASRIDAVAQRNDSDVARQLVLFTKWSAINLGRVREVEPHMRAALDLALRSPLPYVQVLARYMAGVSHWAAGRIPEACEHFAVAIEIREAPKRGLAPKVRLPPVDVPGLASLAYDLAGDRATSDRCFADALEWMSLRGSPSAIVDTNFIAAFILAARGDVDGVLRHTEQALDPAVGVQIAHFTPASRVMHGWARTLRDRAPAGCEECRAGLAEIEAGDARIAMPMLRSLYGEALLAMGEADAAAQVLEQARTEALDSGEVWWLPETLRLLAEARRATGAPADEVEALLEEARARADAQGEPALAARLPQPSREGGI